MEPLNNGHFGTCHFLSFIERLGLNFIVCLYREGFLLCQVFIIGGSPLCVTHFPSCVQISKFFRLLKPLKCVLFKNGQWLTVIVGECVLFGAPLCLPARLLCVLLGDLKRCVNSWHLHMKAVFQTSQRGG